MENFIIQESHKWEASINLNVFLPLPWPIDGPWSWPQPNGGSNGFKLTDNIKHICHDLQALWSSKDIKTLQGDNGIENLFMCLFREGGYCTIQHLGHLPRPPSLATVQPSTPGQPSGGPLTPLTGSLHNLSPPNLQPFTTKSNYHPPSPAHIFQPL